MGGWCCTLALQVQVVAGILNWLAPCCLNSDQLNVQANMAAYVANQDTDNIVAVLLPQFSYKKGQLLEWLVMWDV